MGQGVSFYCETCKKAYSLGYGSYSNSLYSTSVSEFLKEDENLQKFDRNQNLLKCLKHHEGHEIHVLGDDYYYEDGNDLVVDSGDIIFENYNEWEEIDLSEWGEDDRI